MVYEKKLESFEELKRELKMLDMDGGIRIDGEYDGIRCFIFLTTSTMGHSVAIYTKKHGSKDSEVPDRQLLIKKYGDEGELIKFLRKVTNKHMEAYSY